MTGRRAILAMPAAGLLAAGPARAQSHAPQRTVRIIVPLPAASVPDIIARLLAEHLSPRWGVPVLVENRPGAGGAIGVEAAMRAAPDGHTLLLGSSGPMGILPAVHQRLPYEPLRDFAAIARIADFPLVLLASPAAGMADLNALLARARVETLDYAGGDIGSTQHLAGALLAAMGGLRLNHIPYRGGGLAQADLMAGRIPLMLDSVSAVLPAISNGRVVPLALCGVGRAAQFPTLPVLAEAVPGYSAVGWMGVFVPAATPLDMAAPLLLALREVLAEPRFMAAVTAVGCDPAPQEGLAFRDFVADELVKWRGLAAVAGISVL